MDAELQQLKDIHLPPAISIWPTAPGWIMLYAILIALLSYLIYGLYKQYKKKYAVRFALAKLQHLQVVMQSNPDNINIAAEISTLLRRTALYYFSREEIAGLSGQAWLDFLNRSGKTTQFNNAIGQLLLDAPYRKNNIHDLSPLFTLTQNWLKTISKKKNLPRRK